MSDDINYTIKTLSVCMYVCRIIKSKLSLELLPAALEGLGDITHLMNIDTVDDLIALLRGQPDLTHTYIHTYIHAYDISKHRNSGSSAAGHSCRPAAVHPRHLKNHM